MKAALQFTEDVEFFVHGDQSLNCSAVPRTEEDPPHLVIINSGLLERFTDAELTFILGHELGHLISRNSELQRVIHFIFPDGDAIPLSIRDKVEVWDKLSEMSADRFGYLAQPDIKVCLAVFFKLSSGLTTESIRFDPAAYMLEMERVLEAFRSEMADVGVSHPINPIRLKALQHLHTLHLHGAHVTDASLESLKNLVHLKKLHLAWNKISDDTIRHLVPLTALEELDLRHTGVTGASLALLKNLPKLRSLDLSYLTITDEHLLRVAERYGATHALLWPRTATRMPVLYEDLAFKIVRVETP